MILPGEEEDLRRYLAERRQAGIRLNLNLLGEAILGEAEAGRRLEAYLALLARDDVEYISVKVSSIVARSISSPSGPRSSSIKERLRMLYRQALRHHYRQPDGRRHAEVHQPRHGGVPRPGADGRRLPGGAGRARVRCRSAPVSSCRPICPTPSPVQQELTAWATARCGRGGAPIKLRIVKGANLAMERVDARSAGWPQAPYPPRSRWTPTSSAWSAYGCRPEHARAVHLGIGSHNLFDIAYGIVLRERQGVERSGRVRDAGGHGQPSGAGGAGAGGRPACSTRRS